MALPNSYVQVYGQIPEFLAKLQQGQAPEKFTQQHLKDIGFTSSNFRAFLPLLKALGFLSADGTPTSIYHAYRNKAEAPKVLGSVLREVYSDLFFIKDPPTEKDKDLVEGKFKSVHNVADRPAELMARTFFALAKIADFSHGHAENETNKPIQKSQKREEHPLPEPISTHQKQSSTSPSLHYNIQIHLPATKDLEVYNAIFKSLKEHLLG